jgi:hypothetical protein
VAKDDKNRAPDDRVRTTRQPHRRGLPVDLRGDERAESPLGQLRLRNKITEDQYDGGSLFAATVESYRQTIASPRGLINSLGKLVVDDFANQEEEADDADRDAGCATEFSGSGAYCKIYPDDCSCLKKRDRYMAAFDALRRGPYHILLLGKRMRLDPRTVARVVVRFVVHREAIPQEHIVYLKLGLDRLAAHYALIDPRELAN